MENLSPVIIRTFRGANSKPRNPKLQNLIYPAFAACGSLRDVFYWFGLASKSSITTEKMFFSGDRERVRASAIEHALLLLLAASSECC